MNTQNSQDFERLSAYVDNQLSPAEKAELETRLAKEPELQSGLRDLQHTVRALRGLPPVKPPRSFTLTPEQVGARTRRGPLFPVLRLAAAVCALVLAGVVVGDFATSGGLAGSATHDLSSQNAAVTPLTNPMAAQLETPTPSPSSGEAYGAGGAAPSQTAAADIATTRIARLNVQESSPTPTGPDQQPASTAGPTIKTIEPSPTPESTSTPVVSIAAGPPAATETTFSNTAPPPAPQTPVEAPSRLRLVEITLAALALVFIAAAWFTRRA